MSEAAARLWDVITKLVGAIGLIAGGLWTVKQYFDDRTNERALAREREKSASIEARKPFLSKQLDLYFQASGAASSIASGPPGQAQFFVDTFWSLYWGPMALVEDELVTKAMIQFGDGLKANAPQDELKIYALELAHACRDSIARSWKVTLTSAGTSRFLPPIK